jgi:hypothetical protein
MQLRLGPASARPCVAVARAIALRASRRVEVGSASAVVLGTQRRYSARSVRRWTP